MAMRNDIATRTNVHFIGGDWSAAWQKVTLIAVLKRIVIPMMTGCARVVNNRHIMII